MRSIQSQEQTRTLEPDAYPLEFPELIIYIVEMKSNAGGPAVFRLVDIVHQYRQRLEQIGIKAPDINCTRLHKKLLELEAHKQGRYVLLDFQSDIGLTLSTAFYYNAAKILGKAACDGTCSSTSRYLMELLMTDVLKMPFHRLHQFVGMFEHGADTKSQLRFVASKTDMGNAQLLQHSCNARYKEGVVTHRHSKDKGTPFPIYLGMSVYAKTRKWTLMEMLHKHGLAISLTACWKYLHN